MLKRTLVAFAGLFICLWPSLFRFGRDDPHAHAPLMSGARAVTRQVRNAAMHALAELKQVDPIVEGPLVDVSAAIILATSGSPSTVQVTEPPGVTAFTKTGTGTAQ